MELRESIHDTGCQCKCTCPMALKSIPSSADTYLVAAVNNWVIGHSVKKKEKSAYMQGMEP